MGIYDADFVQIIRMSNKIWRDTFITKTGDEFERH